MSMNKTRIDWCDVTWNPVTGCLHDCEYCYARKYAMRYGGHDHDENMNPVSWLFAHRLQRLNRPKHIMQANGLQKAPYPWFFLPTFYEYRLDEPERIKKPQTIFVCSMADLFGGWVPDSWIQDVFRACDRAPQHQYLFLTKNPQRYVDLAQKGMLPPQHWYGYTATTENDLWRVAHADEVPIRHLFVSIEPIQQRLVPGFCSHCPADWVIVGAETGNRKGKVVPEREWIEHITAECELSGIPLFMKESLRTLMGDQFVQELPWEAQGRDC